LSLPSEYEGKNIHNDADYNAFKEQKTSESVKHVVRRLVECWNVTDLYEVMTKGQIYSETLPEMLSCDDLTDLSPTGFVKALLKRFG
jgi:hypothetical protein